MVRERYGGSLLDALRDLFPDTTIDKETESMLGKRFLLLYAYSFSKLVEFWRASFYRNVIVSFAREKGFEPLIANNWYQVSPMEVEKFKVLFTILLIRTNHK